jgi:hypothetical protein
LLSNVRWRAGRSIASMLHKRWSRFYEHPLELCAAAVSSFEGDVN